MRVLVATNATQGTRTADCCGTVEGELVRLPVVLPGHPAGADRPRGFLGMSSRAITTTAKVSNRNLDTHVLAQLFEEDWRDRGLEVGEALRRLIGSEVVRLTQVAEHFALDTVLERHGPSVRARARRRLHSRSTPAIHPSPPRADVALPWDQPIADVVATMADARRRVGDTFVVDSGGVEHLFVFSPAGVRAFYALPEADASKGVADWQMLLRKLPPELFDGRRTLPHDLFGREDVGTYLVALDGAIDDELAELGDTGEVDVFALTRRLGHRLGLASWAGADSARGQRFTALVAALDALDAVRRLRPSGGHGRGRRATDHARNGRRWPPPRRCSARPWPSAAPVRRVDDLLARIVERWSDVDRRRGRPRRRPAT